MYIANTQPFQLRGPEVQGGPTGTIAPQRDIVEFFKIAEDLYEVKCKDESKLFPLLLRNFATRDWKTKRTTATAQQIANMISGNAVENGYYA
jgi:hypothetical protein